MTEEQENNKIEEEISFRKPNPEYRGPIPKKEPERVENVEAEIPEFIQTGREFWGDIQAIVDMLNLANPQSPIYDYRSPVITNYLIWRLLAETKRKKRSN